MAIEHYARQTEGGMSIDVDAMLADIILVHKAAGIPMEQLLCSIREAWDLVEVQITIPKKAKS